MRIFRNIYSCLGNYGWDILILLKDRNMTYSQLLKNLKTHRATLGATLRCLKASGLIYQKRSLITFQKLDYSLTPKGEKLLNTARDGLMEVELECPE